jgi:hypothetical protein
MKVEYYIKTSEEDVFTLLHDTESVRYETDEMRNGKLVVTTYEKNGNVTKVSKLCYKGKNWYKIIQNNNEDEI